VLAILERRNSEGLSAYPQLVQSPFMGRTSISQKTIVQLMRAFRDYGTVGSELDEAPNFAEELYEQDFPDWFVTHAKTYYGWHWREKRAILLPFQQFVGRQHTRGISL
jgi:hypothetical protein